MVLVAVVATTVSFPICQVQAAPVSAVYAFGDSLSDAGNVYLATSGAEPAPPYYQGHFSNGPTWVEDLASQLGLAPLKPSLAGGNDYAFGGAVTGSSVPGVSAAVPNITQQVAQYIAASGGPGHASPTALYTVWIGANDTFQAVADVAASIITPTMAASDLAAAAEVEATALDALAKDGGKTFLVPLVPALGLTPNLNTTPLANLGTALAAGYNADLASDLATVAASDNVKIDTVDTFSLLENAVADPAAYGYTNATAPCYVGPFTGGGSTCNNPDQYLFWDGLHPTQTGHLLIAEEALVAVPEPASLPILIGAFGSLMLLFALRACSKIIAPGRGVEQALSPCFHGQLYRGADALISDAALRPRAVAANLRSVEGAAAVSPGFRRCRNHAAPRHLRVQPLPPSPYGG
jgi:phospholipase/lecithinase/hemolysin